MAKKTKKKEPTWEDMGKFMGEKFGKKFEGMECASWKKPWSFCTGHEGGGFIGRLVFILGLVFALKAAGILAAAPTWTVVLIIIGFALMRL